MPYCPRAEPILGNQGFISPAHRLNGFVYRENWLENLPKDIARAQGASYLGVVLEECGFLEWNKEHGGIAWRLLETDFSPEALEARLQGRGG